MMGLDRAGGGRSDAGVNPPAVILSGQFSPSGYPPPPLDIDGQIRLARTKGFGVSDEGEARAILSALSYQHLSAYAELFEDERGHVPDGTPLRDAYRAFQFDRSFQVLMLSAVGFVELKVRSQYALHLSLERGAFAHREPRNFRDEGFHAVFLRDYGRELSLQLRAKNRHVTKAYERYGDAPLWLAVELMSLGTLSKLYRNTRSRQVRARVAASFGADPDLLVSWLRCLTHVRNACAHFERLVGRPLVSRPRRVPGLDVPADSGSPLYAALVLERLLAGGEPSRGPSARQAFLLASSLERLFSAEPETAVRCGIPADYDRLLFHRSLLGTQALEHPWNR